MRVSADQVACAREVALLDLIACLTTMGVLVFKIDADFVPIKDKETIRVLIELESGLTFELLITGQKWFDTRSQVGGGGAIDFYQHIAASSFTKAVKVLLSCNNSS
jgi:hypothetical protein